MPESLFLPFMLTYQLPPFSRKRVCLSRGFPSYDNVISLLMSCGCRRDEPAVPAHEEWCGTAAAPGPHDCSKRQDEGQQKAHCRCHLFWTTYFWFLRSSFAESSFLRSYAKQLSLFTSPCTVLQEEMQVACSTPFAPVMPLHSCQAAPLNSCSLVFHQQWPLHCLSQLTPHFLSCEVPPGWRLLQVAGEWTTAGQLVRAGCQSAMRTPSPHPDISLPLPGAGLCVWENAL